MKNYFRIFCTLHKLLIMAIELSKNEFENFVYLDKEDPLKMYFDFKKYFIIFKKNDALIIKFKKLYESSKCTDLFFDLIRRIHMKCENELIVKINIDKILKNLNNGCYMDNRRRIKKYIKILSNEFEKLNISIDK